MHEFEVFKIPGYQKEKKKKKKKKTPKNLLTSVLTMLCRSVLLVAASFLGACSLTSSTMYAPSDENVYYSPYVWKVTNSGAATINSGAYMRFLFSGSYLNFHFDVSNMANPASEVYWTVDNGPKTPSLVLPTVSVQIPPNNTNAQSIPYHSVELFVKSTTERAQRWSASGGQTRVNVTGIETDGVLASWVPSDVNVLIYGDSITEGVMTLGGTQKFDTDHNDASVVYSSALGHLLGCEIGIVGFGASGLTHNGSGAVPPLNVSWDQLWEGEPRVFDPKPDLILFNEGTNDGCDVTTPGCVGTDISLLMTDIMNSIGKAVPGCPLAVLEPFNGGQKQHLQAAVAATTSNAHYVSTEGFYNISLGGSLHPTGMNDVSHIAPQIANAVRPLLYRSVLARIVSE